MTCRLDKLTHDPVDEQTVYEVSLFGAYKAVQLKVLMM